MSFLLPGAGQAFHGQFWRGVLLLALSFVALPVESLSVVHFGGSVSLAILPLLLAPWLYSMADAAREAKRLNQANALFNRSKGAIYIMVLLVIVFPIVAFVFSLVTLLLLPDHAVIRIAEWTAPLRRLMGLEG
jgi:hypothetical protein